MRHHPGLKGSRSLCQGLESWGFIQFMPQGVKHSEIWSRKRNKDIPGKRQPWCQAAAALWDAGWGRMEEQVSASNRQPEQSSCSGTQLLPISRSTLKTSREPS